MRLARFLVLTAVSGFCKFTLDHELQFINLVFFDSHSRHLVCALGEFWLA